MARIAGAVHSPEHAEQAHGESGAERHADAPPPAGDSSASSSSPAAAAAAATVDAGAADTVSVSHGGDAPAAGASGDLVPQEIMDPDMYEKQQEMIAASIADVPLVSDRLPVAELAAYNADIPNVQSKVQALCARYRTMRKIKGDGNCFLRGLSVGMLEGLIASGDRARIDKIHATLLESINFLIGAGFPEFVCEDFHAVVMEQIGAVQAGTATVDGMIEAFRTTYISEYFVTYLRFLMSAYMQMNADDFAPFIDGARTLVQYCQEVVEPNGRECDEVHIMALTRCMQIAIRIEYLDAGEHDLVTHTYGPEGDAPVCTLLYKPGHYDVLFE